MKASLRVGRVFGVPLDLHWTLILIPLWVLYDGYHASLGLQWARIGWVGGVIILLFSFVLIHELGHALTARFFGKPTEKILLFPLGGGAYIREHPERLFGEIMVYFGGPLANILLALLVIPFLFFDPERWLLFQQYLQPQRNLITSSEWWEELLCLGVMVNLVLAALNLLPAYPLDGGRILQALLRKPLGERKSTLVVTVLGVVASVGFIWAGYLLSDPIMGVGGLFVGLLSLYEINRGWQRRRLQKHTVGQLFRPMMEDRLYAGDSLAKARELLDSSGWPALPVYNRWNQLVGLLTEETMEHASDEDELINGYYDTSFATGFPTDNLLAMTERIIEADAYGALVYDRYRPVGFLLMEDVMGLLERRF
ncbi:hypothetical protein CEQ90_18575 [Lewinellaceae bacterium SD302]|nr:hypothetical protein CEQ90_18575 [Lewinellaceae bacterium SD302]